MTNLYDLIQKHASEDDDEKKWILHECKDPILLKHMNSMTGNMLHVLDAIGRLEPVNSIVISRDTGIPKGTVSKIIPKLISKKFIIKEGVPNNRKEFIFHITPLGKELFLLHQTLHKRAEVGIKSVLDKYKSQELSIFNRILEDFCKLSWVDENTPG
jgi:DNA-binding MarR family transcriptional regulator